MSGLFNIRTMEDKNKLIKLIQEKGELALLLENGISFTVGKESYTIAEPPLTVFDALAAEMLEIEIEDELLKENTRVESYQLIQRHSTRMSRIVAIAVLGIDFRDTQRLNKLSKKLHESLTPSKLENLFSTIRLMMNTGSFMSSIRLISEIKTGLPGLIERGA